MLHFHKWEYIRKYYDDEFEGIRYSTYIEPYRICTNCGKSQERIADYWSALCKQKANILKAIIVDKGSYFKLSPSKKKIRNALEKIRKYQSHPS